MGLSILQIMELAASLTAAFGATLIMLPRRIGWLFLFLSGLLYITLFACNKLYATLILQMGFASLSLFGLISWSKNAGKAKIFQPIRYPLKKILRDLLLAGLFAFLWAEILALLTDDPHPYLDGALSIYAMLAQYWMSRAYFCNWILWMIVDTAYAACLFFWGLPLSGLLYGYLGLLSIAGLIHWQKMLNRQA